MSRTIRNRHNRGDMYAWKKKNLQDEYYIEARKLHHRDGYLFDGGRHYYRELTRDERRRLEYNFLLEVRLGRDVDNIAYPCEKEMKHNLWNVW